MFFGMSVCSITLAALSLPLVIGCATQEQQPTVQGGGGEFRSRMHADNVNVASAERRDWAPPKEKSDQR